MKDNREIESFMESYAKGAVLALDPLGALYSKITGGATVGKKGLAEPGIKTNRFGKGCGVYTGAATQIIFLGLPQLALALIEAPIVVANSLNDLLDRGEQPLRENMLYVTPADEFLPSNR